MSRERGRKLFAGQPTFVMGAVAMSGLPPADRLEVCFAGRSNAGKSSLINALTGTGKLARISRTPGRTQEINFFSLGPIYLVDLPGYGYAEAPVAIVQRWQTFLKQYLAGRPTLRRVFLLVDSRRGLRESDEEIMRLLDISAVTFQIVLTKVDKIGALERERILKQIRTKLAKHPAAYPELVLTSSNSGNGIAALRAMIAGMTSSD